MEIGGRIASLRIEPLGGVASRCASASIYTARVTLGAVWTLRSTMPFTAIAGTDLNIDSNKYNSLDVRASKAFSLGGNRKIELVGQLFNIFGTDNLLASGALGAWVNNARSDSFGHILQAFPRQQAELAIRFVW